jgi:hypothetical protein
MAARVNPLWLAVDAGQVELERRCPRCHPSQQACSLCDGTGVILTTEGAKLIAFLLRHLDAHADLIGEQVDRLEAERAHPLSIVRRD